MLDGLSLDTAQGGATFDSCTLKQAYPAYDKGNLRCIKHKSVVYRGNSVCNSNDFNAGASTQHHTRRKVKAALAIFLLCLSGPLCLSLSLSRARARSHTPTHTWCVCLIKAACEREEERTNRDRERERERQRQRDRERGGREHVSKYVCVRLALALMQNLIDVEAPMYLQILHCRKRLLKAIPPPPAGEQPATPL
jgi:hypothetical protein